MSSRTLGTLAVAACLVCAAGLARAQGAPPASPRPASQPARAPAFVVPAGARALTLDECVDVALSRNPDVAVADEEIVAAVAAKNAMRGNFGPKGRVEYTVLRWDSPLNLDFSGFLAMFQQLGLPIPPGTSASMAVRDPTTTTLTLSALQPVGALWGIYEGYKVRELGVDVAKVRRYITLRDTAYAATEAFYRTLQTMRLAEVAHLSVEQLDAQVLRARSFFKHGLIGNNDLLRAELGLANARQRWIAARGNVTLAQGRLAFVLGLPGETAVVPTGAPTEPPAPESTTEDEAERRALTTRLELRELELRIGQANRGVSASWSRMVPDLNLLFSYQHNTGSSFSQANAYFGGMALTWNFWEWGATYYGVPEAKARLRQALAARAKVRDGIRLETRAAYVTQASAAEMLRVAQQSVNQAEENYRLETKRYEARANTSFDVIDAETQLTSARAQLQTALYDYLIARAALVRAMGEGPVATRRDRRASPEGSHAAP
ncbi:MAG TPA: TolC family protein [Polyangia bacterium]